MLTEAEKLHYEWELLEALLFWTSFSDGSLDERVLSLPRRAFAQAVALMDALGWVDLSA